MTHPNIKRISLILSSFSIGLLLFSCSGDDTPKPRAYFRIELPKKEYRSFDTTFPYSFEYPVYGIAKARPDKVNDPYWLNLEFPRFRGTVYISYLKINGNLDKLLDDTRELVNKHIPKANGIDEIDISNPKNHVFGTLWDIRGNDAASPYQFYVTDSTKNFVRGALYFNVKPNNDSLSPVIDFLKADIDRLIQTFRWK
ncbi:MAG: gliding motility lipoprotein GldD [Bacteroidota bacterium]